MMRTMLIATLLLFGSNAWGQNWQLRAIQHVSLSAESPDNRSEGMEFSLFRNFTFSEKTYIVGGISWTTNSWANHVLLKVGASNEFATYKNWSFSTQLELGNGIALFTPSPLYTYDIQGLIFMNLHTKKENQWSLGVGLQFISTPQYKKYSSNFTSVNLPLSFRYHF